MLAISAGCPNSCLTFRRIFCLAFVQASVICILRFPAVVGNERVQTLCMWTREAETLECEIRRFWGPIRRPSTPSPLNRNCVVGPLTLVSQIWFVFLPLCLNKRVRGSKPGGDEILRTSLHGLQGPPSLLYSASGSLNPGVKRPGCGVNHPPSSSAEVKVRVELYVYLPSGSSCPP